MARQTSINAYRAIEASGLLSKRKWEVYQILYEYGPLTSTEIIQKYKETRFVAETGGITTRLSELKRLSCATEVGEKKNPATGMNQYLWDVTSNLPIKFEKNKSKDQQIKELTEELLQIKSELDQLKANIVTSLI